jgi:hypothetical protein
MATILNKPIMLFLEEDVEITGIEERVTSFFVFNRNDILINGAVKIVKFLNSTKENLLEILVDIPKNEDDIIVTTLNVSLVLENTKHWLIERDFNLKALKPITEINDSTWISNGVSFPFIDPKFSAENYNYSDLHDVDYKITNITPESVQWKIFINPALKKDDIFSYSWSLSTKGYIPIFFEEIIDHSNVYGKNRKFVEEGITITSPTEELIFTVNFPSGYNIEDCYFSVLKGADPGVKIAYSEVERINKNNFFIKNIKRKRCSLELKIKNPLFLHTYQLFWKPPCSSLLKNIFKQ